MDNLRPILPALIDQEQQPKRRIWPTYIRKPKRRVTSGACVACQNRKSKCNGTRPTCARCAQKGSQCIYERALGEGPLQAIKRRNEEMQGELSNFRQLYSFLQMRPEQQALEILRRIRAKSPSTTPSQHLEELGDFICHGDLPIQPATSSAPSHQLTTVPLPPLRTILCLPSEFLYSANSSAPLNGTHTELEGIKERTTAQN